ncbi:MAG TPA: L,D-transpeptidase, partial [Anaerolineaceae bacterium]|nr:L,D-transpeptidase [Anaerolineaceae bacterium]
MKPTLRVALPWIALLALAIFTTPASAQAGPLSANEPSAGSPLCLPDIYLIDPVDCLPLGPSARLTELAQMGMKFPADPLPAVAPDPSLVQSPASIARINLDEHEKAPLFTSFEDATAGQNPTAYIDPGYLRYVSFVNVAYYNDKPYLQLKSGAWIRASPVAYSDFQGLEFTRTPDHDFGWIFDLAEVRTAPGYASPLRPEKLLREDVVSIYDTREADGTTWYMIGLDQWVERRYIRQVRVNTTPPEGVDNNRWIEVNLYDQTISVYDEGRLAFATMIATGLDPFFTRPGLFQIFERLETETMSGSFEADRSDYYYLEDVPWT